MKRFTFVLCGLVLALFAFSARVEAAAGDHVIMHDADSGKVAYWVMNSNGTLKNRTRADGWNYMDGTTDGSGVKMAGQWKLGAVQNNWAGDGEGLAIWENASDGKRKYWKLNSTGVLKNRTLNDGFGDPTPDFMPGKWRVQQIRTP